MRQPLEFNGDSDVNVIGADDLNIINQYDLTHVLKNYLNNDQETNPYLNLNPGVGYVELANLKKQPK